MANDFDIIRTGSELASRGPQTSNTSGNGVNWWLVGGSLVVLVAVGVMAHQAGKNTVMPKLSAANEENEKLKKKVWYYCETCKDFYIYIESFSFCPHCGNKMKVKNKRSWLNE